MDFRTQMNPPSYPCQIAPQDRVMFLGSCFAVNIGTRLMEHTFPTCINPFGVLYNPASICHCIETLDSSHPDYHLFEQEGIWSSWLTDTKITANEKAVCEETIRAIKDKAFHFLQNSQWLFITLGTNHVYRLKENDLIVSNCHKLPPKNFTEEILDLETCIHYLQRIIQTSLKIRPDLHLVFTVSPYRYAKYGFHENQLSKATLLLACNTLCNQHPDRCHYFPAYEIMMDDLRDYRFYKEDMLHPSDQAISYIWEFFHDSLLDEAAQNLVAEWQEIQKAIRHRPLHPNSERYQSFLRKTLLKIEMIQKKYPNLAISSEVRSFCDRLK